MSDLSTLIAWHDLGSDPPLRVRAIPFREIIRLGDVLQSPAGVALVTAAHAGDIRAAAQRLAAVLAADDSLVSTCVENRHGERIAIADLPAGLAILAVAKIAELTIDPFVVSELGRIVARLTETLQPLSESLHEPGSPASEPDAAPTG